ncbi:tetracycline resistance MFS efflux pump [soil metagenome]
MFKENRNLAIIGLIALVNALGYGIIIPIMYSYSKQFGLSDFQTGLLFALFSLCQFISTPIIGRLSDKYGRRPLLIASITGTALSFFLLAWCPNVIVLFIARALDGITAGNIPVAMAVISDTTKPEERAKGFGIIGASFGFGFLFGPAIAALTVGISAALPFIIAGIISVIAIAMTWFFLPETNDHMGQVQKGKMFDFVKMWHMLFDPNVGVTFIITLFYFMAFACAIIYGFQPYTKNVLHVTDTQNALLFVLFGAVGLFSQMFFVGRFTKKFGIKHSFSLSIFFTGFSFLIMAFSHSLPLFVIGSVVLGLFNGISQTLIPTILSNETDAKSQGSIMGLNTSYQSIGMIIGPIMGGFLATFAVFYPLLVGSVITFLCLLLSFQVLKPGVKKESAF